jgi:ribose transport system permease protein
MTASAAKEKKAFQGKTIFKELMSKPEITVLAALIVICVVMVFLRPTTFPTVRNFFNIIRQFSIIAILAVGMGLIIITGGIDLSVGSIIAFSACLGAYIFQKFNLPPFAILLIILIAGIAFGFFNGVLVAYVGIPPFIVTLGSKSIALGLALLITNGSPITYQATWISYLGGGYIGPVPVSVIVMLLVVGVAFIFANNTMSGRNIYAVGNNKKAAKLSGISVEKTLVLVYVILGLLAGLCAILLIGEMNSADPSFGNGSELNVIAAAVIGGISMSGGKGNILGVVVGAALMGVLENIFVLLAVSGYWQTIIIGVVIVLAVALDSISKKRELT